MRWNVLSSLILTLTAVDKLFNIVLFPVGILLSRLQGIIIYHSYLVCSPRPSCHLPYRPHKSAISRVSHYTKNGLACRARPSQPARPSPEDFALHRTTASGPVLCHPSRLLGIIPAVPRGAPGRFGTLSGVGPNIFTGQKISPGIHYIRCKVPKGGPSGGTGIPWQPTRVEPKIAKTKRVK